MLQTWQPITDPSQDQPLAPCDGQALMWSDVIPQVLNGPKGSTSELPQGWGGHFISPHRWSYLGDMTGDDIPVFKSYDSASIGADGAANLVLHTAIGSLSPCDAVPRGSVECRFLALYN